MLARCVSDNCEPIHSHITGLPNHSINPPSTITATRPAWLSSSHPHGSIIGTVPRRAGRIGPAGGTMKKTCPRCEHQSGTVPHTAGSCGYRFPEQSSPRPAGLAMGAGFPLFVTGR